VPETDSDILDAAVQTRERIRSFGVEVLAERLL
jgi:hypothetical protein